MANIYIPFPKALYDDIVRFSDGEVSPTALAESQVLTWVEMSIEYFGYETWGERLEDIAAIYAPRVLEKWKSEDKKAQEISENASRPLVWKLVVVPSGSDVRMSYGGTHHYAKVVNGHIEADGVKFSPSEWASKVAGNTSRNAWRDLWFRYPRSANWESATALREKVIKELDL